MQKRCKSSLWFLFFFIFIASSLRSSVPGQMNYQGRMFNLGTSIPVPDSSGNSMTFSVYNVASGGTPLWSETQNGSVTTKNGLFNVILGKTTPLNLPFDVPYWLEVTFNGQLMSPRQPLVTAPYAFHAAVADNASVSAPLNLSTGTTSAVFQATNTGTGLGIIATGVSFGISATASSSTGSAIYGRAASNTGAIYGINDGSGGYGVYGQSNGGMAGVYGQGGSQAGVYGSSSGAPYGVEGFAVAGSIAGVYGNYTSAGNGAGVLGQGSSGAGVSGTASSSSGIGVAGYNNSGFGTEGFGQTGTAGVAAVNGGVGILAWDGGKPSALALHSLGNDIFDGVGNTVTFNTYVSFAGGTNISSGSVNPPLNLVTATAGAVLTANNTINGTAISAIAASGGKALQTSGSSQLNGMVSIYANSVFGQSSALFVSQTSANTGGPAITAYSPASATAAIYGQSFDLNIPGPNSNAGYGVAGKGPIGIVGVNNIPAGIGVVGSVDATGNTNSTGVLGVNNGQGTGVQGQGVTGVAGTSVFPGGAGLVGYDGGNTNSLALRTFGNSIFDGGGNTVTFNTYVSFTAGTNLGGGGGVPNPLNLVNNISSPNGVLSGTNNGTGAGVVASGVGTGLSATASAGNAVYAANSLSHSAGYFYNSDTTTPTQSSSFGRGIEAYGAMGAYLSANAPSGVGVFARLPSGGSGGVAIMAESNGSGTGVAADGGPIGVLASATSAGGTGGIFQGATGLYASGTSLGLSVTGGAVISGQIQNTSGGIKFPDNSVQTTAFTGASVPVPLSLTGNVAFPNGVLTATNTGSGHAIIGYATQPGGFVSGIPDFNSPIVSAVKGYTSVTNSTGVAGYSNITFNAGVGVFGIGYVGMAGIGRADVPGSIGAQYNSDAFNGYGIQASSNAGTGGSFNGLTGASASTNAVSGTALVAQSNGPSSLAIHSFGNSTFDGAGSVVTFNTYVSFTAGTNLGAGGGVPNPLSLTGNVSFPGGVITASNTGSGHGLVGYANTPGSFGNGPTPSSLLVGGVTGYTSASNSAGVLGFSTLTYTAGSGVAGIGYVGMYAAGRVDVPASVGIRAEGETVNGVGVSADAGLGTAVNAQGLTGVAAISNLVTGTALVASNNFGGLAIHSFGNGIFDGGGNTVTFNTFVSFTAGTNLAGGGGVTAPLPLTSSTSQATISGNNTNPSNIAVGVSGSATTNTGAGPSLGVYGNYSSTGLGYGYGVEGQVSANNNLNAGVAGIFGNSSMPASLPGGAGILGTNDNGWGVYGQAINSSGIGVAGLGGFVGVSASATSANGAGAYFQGVTGAVISGSSIGVSVTSSGIGVLVNSPAGSSNDGVQINYSGSNSALRATSNNNLVSTMNVTNNGSSNALDAQNNGGGVAVYATGSGTGNSNPVIYGSNSSAMNTSIGIYGQSSSGYGMIAAGGAIGLSATTTSLSGNAIYARASTSTEAIRGQNDDTTTASFGVHGSAKNTGIGVYGEVLGSAAGSAGVEGHNTAAGGYGVWADNGAATVAGGGAALFVNGLMKMSFTSSSNSVTDTATTPAVDTLNAPNGRIYFTSISAPSIPPAGYTVTNSFVTDNSTVSITFHGALSNSPPAFAVSIPAGGGSFKIQPAANLNWSSTSNFNGISFVIINQ